MLTLYNDQLGGTTYSFGSVAAFLANSPSSIAFNGDLSAKSPFTGLSGLAHLRQNLYIFYAQDEYKLLPTLTMSYGLRYEYYQPLHDVNNKAVIFDIAKGDIVAGTSAPWYKSSKKNFGPRLAFSWSPERFKNNTVFRIGGGYYYGPGQTEDQLQPSANDRIGRTITSGPQLVYPFDVSTIFQTYNVNDPNLGFQPRAYGVGYGIPETHSLLHRFGAAVSSGECADYRGVCGQPGAQPLPAQRHQQDHRRHGECDHRCGLGGARVRQPVRGDRLQDQRRNG